MTAGTHCMRPSKLLRHSVGLCRAFSIYMMLAHRAKPPLPVWPIKTVQTSCTALVKAAKAGKQCPSIAMPVDASPPQARPATGMQQPAGPVLPAGQLPPAATAAMSASMHAALALHSRAAAPPHAQIGSTLPPQHAHTGRSVPAAAMADARPGPASADSRPLAAPLPPTTQHSQADAQPLQGQQDIRGSLPIPSRPYAALQLPASHLQAPVSSDAARHMGPHAALSPSAAAAATASVQPDPSSSSAQPTTDPAHRRSAAPSLPYQSVGSLQPALPNSSSLTSWQPPPSLSSTITERHSAHPAPPSTSQLSHAAQLAGSSRPVSSAPLRPHSTLTAEHRHANLLLPGVMPPQTVSMQLPSQQPGAASSPPAHADCATAAVNVPISFVRDASSLPIPHVSQAGPPGCSQQASPPPGSVAASIARQQLLAPFQTQATPADKLSVAAAPWQPASTTAGSTVLDRLLMDGISNSAEQMATMQNYRECRGRLPGMHAGAPTQSGQHGTIGRALSGPVHRTQHLAAAGADMLPTPGLHMHAAGRATSPPAAPAPLPSLPAPPGYHVTVGVSQPQRQQPSHASVRGQADANSRLVSAAGQQFLPNMWNKIQPGPSAMQDH